MTSVLGLSMPKIGMSKNDLTSPKTLALGAVATTALAGGGIIGQIKGNPLAGLAIGGAIAAVAIGASLVGNASDSYLYDDHGGGHYDWHDDGHGGHYDYHDPHH